MKRIARKLRQSQTSTERLLWGCLRKHRVDGFGFRRQQPIGPYVVDFCCFEKRLIIEVDGRAHDCEQQIEKDRVRQDYLEACGFRVIRFTTDDLVLRLEGGCGSYSAGVGGILPP